MPLVDQPFEDTFTFARGCAGPYRDPSGARQTADLDVPRLDHNATGTVLGLRVEGFGMVVSPDRLAIVAGDWATPAGTVLHEMLDEDGQLQRRAFYALHDPQPTVDSCLNTVGWHRRIAFVPVTLKNRGGYVRWRNEQWSLGAALAAAAGVLLAATENYPLLEG